MIVCVCIQIILKSGTGAKFCHHKPVDPLYSATSALYSYGTVPHWRHTVTVWSHPCTTQWLYSEDVGLSIGTVKE